MSRSLDVLAAIDELARQHGYAPSLTEVGAVVGMRSKHAVWLHVHALAAQGLLTHEPTKPRTLRVTEAGRSALAARAA